MYLVRRLNGACDRFKTFRPGVNYLVMKKYRKQYVLTKYPQKPGSFENWNAEHLRDYVLYSSPDLPKYVARRGDETLILLGLAFHVLDPDIDEPAILEGFPNKHAEFLDYLDQLCGNFLLLRITPQSICLYNDAAGVMKMFYDRDDQEIKAVAIDPNLLKEFRHLEKDSDAHAVAFYSGKFFTKSLIRLGALTAYRNVFQVLPNHELNLATCEVTRIFPRTPRVEKTVEEAADEVHTYFTNVLDAAARKYDLKCSLTAGWDSRMVTAFTQKHHDKVLYYTFMHPSYDENHHDIKIPRRIARRLGLQHEVVSKDVALSSADQQEAKAQFDLLPQENFDNIMGGYPKFGQERDMVLIGSLSEICKNYYDETWISDGKSLAQAAHFPVMPYTVSYFQAKYTELNAVSEKYGYDLRDLAHWEQDITNFAAKRTLYMSFITHAFSPFNSRLIIKTILDAPRKSRDKQQHKFYRTYLRRHYPQLNQFPVNPTLKRRFIVLGKKLGIYGVYKILTTRLKK